MILTHNNTTVTYFDNFPKSLKRVGLELSGGTDSALMLYCLAKTLDDRRQYTTEIFLYHHKLSRYKKSDSVVPMLNVLSFVRSCFPNVVIHDPDVCTLQYAKPAFMGIKLKHWHAVYSIIRIKRKYRIERWMSGILRSDTKGSWAPYRIYQRITTLLFPNSFPWKDVDKHFIAHQYKSLDIEPLSLLTHTCVSDVPGGLPCRQCGWCKNRYNAFGNYDHGLK